MAYDETLASRIEEILVDKPQVEQKKMFGGLAFMVRRHMCVGVNDDRLMARVGPEAYEQCLQKKHASEMTFTGKPLKGMVYVDAAGIKSDAQLRGWIDTCLAFVASLPDKSTDKSTGKSTGKSARKKN